MKKLLIILSLSMGNAVFCQTKYTTVSDEFANFHQAVSSAERMYKNDSLLQAYAKYDIAIVNYKGAINPTHYYKAACCALKIKEEYKALSYLEKAITNGYRIDTVTSAPIDFFNLNTKKEYQDNIKKWIKERDAKRNYTWESDLYQTTVDGKKFTTPAYKTAIEYCASCMANPKCLKTTPEYQSKYRLVKEKMKADSVVAVRLISDIKKFGFPNLKIVDQESCNTAKNILLNYDADKKNERLNDILYNALIAGHISPEFYAKVIDRRNIRNGLAPEFFEPITGFEKTAPKDIAVANTKRKTIGLYNVMMPKVSTTLKTTTKPVAKGAVAPPLVENNLYNY
jgi:hypothetical protein